MRDLVGHGKPDALTGLSRVELDLDATVVRHGARVPNIGVRLDGNAQQVCQCQWVERRALPSGVHGPEHLCAGSLLDGHNRVAALGKAEDRGVGPGDLLCRHLLRALPHDSPDYTRSDEPLAGSNCSREHQSKALDTLRRVSQRSLPGFRPDTL